MDKFIAPFLLREIVLLCAGKYTINNINASAKLPILSPLPWWGGIAVCPHSQTMGTSLKTETQVQRGGSESTLLWSVRIKTLLPEGFPTTATPWTKLNYGPH